MRYKTEVILVCICFSVCLILLIFSIVNSYPADLVLVLVSIPTLVAQVIGLSMIISSGTTFGTVYWKLILVSLLIFIIGTFLFMIESGFVLRIIGLFGVAITYLIRFIAKQNKLFFDVTKLLFVLSQFIIYPLILPLIFKDVLNFWFAFLGLLLFWLMMLDFIYLEFKRNQ